MGYVIAILIIYFSLYLLWPRIKRWLARRAQKIMMNRMEDMMRSAAGMPPRDKKQQRRRREHTPDTEWSAPPRRPRTSRRGEPKIPKEYAVDVEYTEYKEFTSSTTILDDGNEISWHQENQVSDVEWVEVKEK